MDDERLKQIADELYNDWLRGASSSTMDAIIPALKRGIDVARAHDRQMDTEMASEQRKRDRFELIKASLTGHRANKQYAQMVSMDLVKWVMNDADAILARLDAEEVERKP